MSADRGFAEASYADFAVATATRDGGTGMGMREEKEVAVRLYGFG